MEKTTSLPSYKMTGTMWGEKRIVLDDAPDDGGDGYGVEGAWKRQCAVPLVAADGGNVGDEDGDGDGDEGEKWGDQAAIVRGVVM